MKILTIILATLLLIQLGAFSQSTGLHKLLPEASELDNVALVDDPVIYTAENLPVIQNLMQVLPLEDQALPTVKFLRGYLSLNRIYHFFDEDIWGFHGGVAGLYPWYTIVILKYPDQQKATAQFNFLRKLGSIADKYQSYYSTNSSTFQMVDKRGTKLSFNYYEGFFIIFIYRGKMNLSPLMKEIKHNLDVVYQ